jgi:DNA-directed RNA polymerase alpha subunit
MDLDNLVRRIDELEEKVNDLDTQFYLQKLKLRFLEHLDRADKILKSKGFALGIESEIYELNYTCCTNFIRANNILKKNKIYTIRDLISKNLRDLRDIKGLGKSSIEAIQFAMAALPIYLYEDRY